MQFEKLLITPNLPTFQIIELYIMRTPTPLDLQQLVENVKCRYSLERWTSSKEWRNLHWATLPDIGVNRFTGKYFEGEFLDGDFDVAVNFINYEAVALFEWMVFQRDADAADNHFAGFVQETNDLIPESLHPLVDHFYPNLFDRNLLPRLRRLV